MVALDSPSMNPGYLQGGFKVTAHSMLGSKHMKFSSLQAPSHIQPALHLQLLAMLFHGIMLSSVSRGLGKGLLTPSRVLVEEGAGVNAEEHVPYRNL